MTPTESNKPPNPAPRFLKLMLGLASDSPQQEVQNAWDANVIPLFNVGPKFLFDQLVLNTMGGGLSSQQAYRVVAQSQRGKQLKNSMERETAFRVRMASSVPPFVTSTATQPKKK